MSNPVYRRCRAPYTQSGKAATGFALKFTTRRVNVKAMHEGLGIEKLWRPSHSDQFDGTPQMPKSVDLGTDQAQRLD